MNKPDRMNTIFFPELLMSWNTINYWKAKRRRIVREHEARLHLDHSRKEKQIGGKRMCARLLSLENSIFTSYVSHKKQMRSILELIRNCICRSSCIRYLPLHLKLLDSSIISCQQIQLIHNNNTIEKNDWLS